MFFPSPNLQYGKFERFIFNRVKVPWSSSMAAFLANSIHAHHWYFSQIQQLRLLLFFAMCKSSLCCRRLRRIIQTDTPPPWWISTSRLRTRTPRGSCSRCTQLTWWRTLPSAAPLLSYPRWTMMRWGPSKIFWPQNTFFQCGVNIQFVVLCVISFSSNMQEPVSERK